MHISLNWLQDFVKLTGKIVPQELADQLTLKSAEVEGVVDEAHAFDKMVVGQIVSLEKHSNADKLTVAKVSVGKDTHQIVCGAANLKEGMHVAVTLPGAMVRWHGEGDLVELSETKIRGVESYGMIAAGCEIGIDEPNAKLENIMDLSSIKPEPGTPLSEIFKKDDVIFEFDNKSLTHRPDLWGHYGIARELAAITGSKFTQLVPKVKIPTKGESPKVEIKDFDLCPRYCGIIIDNIAVGESPDWLKARLKATGHGTHGNIVDITNYVMHELGQPMHAFDKSFIEGGIVVRRAEKNEEITTLDDKKRKLDTDTLVIADHKKPVAIAGIMGGENSEINDKTTSIILESANFNGASIRKTSTKLGLRTDAVQRFEKSLDPNLAELAIMRAVELILQICPDATVAGPITDVKKFSDKPVKLKLDTDKARSKIGVKISDAEIKKILESLEFEVSSKFEITVPTFRASKDVSGEDDLIEEVARMYGYDNIEPALPTLPTRLPEANTVRLQKHRARKLLSYGLGLNEVSGYSFYGHNELENCLMDETGHVKILNYLSEDQTHMRTTLVPNLLKNLRENIKHQPEVRVYEVGRSYKEVGDFFPLEEKRIAGAILIKDKSDDAFYEAKGIVESIFKHFSLPKIKSAPGVENAPYAHPTKALSFIDQNAQTIAQVFMLHPQVAKNHELDKYKVALFELNFSELLKLEAIPRGFSPIPKFPSIEIDVSVLIDRTTEIGKIRSAINQSDQNLIQSVTLFDIYEGEGIPDDKKAVAFSITLQADDRTLTDAEMAATQQKIFKALEALGGKIRGGKA